MGHVTQVKLQASHVIDLIYRRALRIFELSYIVYK